MIRVSVFPTVCLRKTKGSLKRLVEIKVKNSSAPTYLEGELLLQRRSYPLRISIPRGESRHHIEVDEPDHPTEIVLRPKGHPLFAEAKCAIAPQRPWEIYLLTHSHNDLGYTELPAMVLASHAEYLDQAVQYCEDTASYPKDARFRWNIECSWQLRNYVQRRPPSAVAELVRQIRDGHIDVSAWYLNMTDVGNLEQTLRAHHFVHDFCRQHEIRLRASMSCDVNGYPWCLPSVLSALNVDCHLSALNTTRSISPLDRPCAFRWESPDGKQILLWHGDHYHIGNYIGIVDQEEFLFERLSEHLHKLEHKGYPYPMALVQVSGTYTDNAPPNRSLSDFVRSWNRRWRSPRIRLTTITEWFKRLRKEIGKELPVYRQAWPDYWADGLASAPCETGLARRARHTIADAEAAHSASHILRQSHQPLPLDAVYEEATFANEHTWGYHASANDPFHPQSLAHWNHKAGFFYRSSIGAESILREARRDIARTIKAAAGKRIVVYNWLSWTRNGLVEVDVPMEWLPEVRGFQLVDLESGEEIPYQVLRETRRELRIATCVQSVPAFGYRVLGLFPDKSPAAFPRPTKIKDGTLENDFYRVQTDRSSGIRSLWNKALEREFVSQKHQHHLAQLISEAIIHKEGREALNGWWFSSHRNKASENEIFRRKTSTRSRILLHQAGPVLSEFEMECRNPALEWQRTVLRLVHTQPSLEIHIRIRKPMNPNPQALYLALPFEVSNPTVWFDAAGGPYRPGIDQIEGSCMDFFTLQDWALITNDEVSVSVVPVDAPLVQLNRITTAQWIRKPPPQTATLYSWLYNNYWTTNFPVTACGDFTFRYVIRTGPPPADLVQVSRFAEQVFSPLEAEILADPQEGSLPEATGSLFEVEPENVQASALKPAKNADGLVLRLQEKSGTKTQARVRFHLLHPTAVKRLTLMEEPEKGTIRKQRNEYRIQLPPFGTRTLHIMVEGVG